MVYRSSQTKSWINSITESVVYCVFTVSFISYFSKHKTNLPVCYYMYVFEWFVVRYGVCSLLLKVYTHITCPLVACHCLLAWYTHMKYCRFCSIELKHWIMSIYWRPFIVNDLSHCDKTKEWRNANRHREQRKTSCIAYWYLCPVSLGITRSFQLSVSV